MYIVLGLLVLLYVVSQVRRSQPVDWKENYLTDKKSPFGAYLVYKALPELFSDGEVTLSKQSPRRRLKTHQGVNEAYLFINTEFWLDDDELEEMLEYVERGNYLFVSAYAFPDTLMSFLKLQLRSNLPAGEFSLKYFPGKRYQIWSEGGWIDPDEEFKGEVLGYDGHVDDESLGRWVNFVCVPHGKGEIYLHACPGGFSNYFLLDANAGDYYAALLSHLPPDVHVVWDEYQKSGKSQWDRIPVKVILSAPALRIGYYLLLLAGLLYLLFRSKREQRWIPIIQAPLNRSLEFVAAVSSLYYKQRDHTSIARKRIDIFLKEVRYKYKLRPDLQDDRFADLLSERSGVARTDADALLEIIKNINERDRVTEAQLRDLFRYLEMFKLKNRYYGRGDKF